MFSFFWLKQVDWISLNLIWHHAVVYAFTVQIRHLYRHMNMLFLFFFYVNAPVVKGTQYGILVRPWKPISLQIIFSFKVCVSFFYFHPLQKQLRVDICTPDIVHMHTTGQCTGAGLSLCALFLVYASYVSSDSLHFNLIISKLVIF